MENLLKDRPQIPFLILSEFKRFKNHRYIDCSWEIEDSNLYM